MVDFNTFDDTDSPENVNIADGSDPTKKVKVSANNDAGVSDIIDTTGLYGSLTVGTTAVEIKVGASKLSNRKLVTLDNTSSKTIFWGYDNSITISNYAGRIFKDQQASWAIGSNVSIYVITDSAGNVTQISEGA